MMAIITRWHPCTGVKGARYSATAGSDRVWESEHDELSADGNHELVLAKLCKKFDWYGTAVRGELIDAQGHPDAVVWVFIHRHRGTGKPLMQAETTHISKFCEPVYENRTDKR